MPLFVIMLMVLHLCQVTIETGRRGQNLFGSFLKEEKQRKEQMDGVNQSGPSEDQHCPASGSVAHQQHMLPISSRSSKSIPILGAQKHTKRRQGGGKDLFNMLSGLGDYEDTKNVLETMHLSDGQPSTRKQLLKGFKDLGIQCFEACAPNVGVLINMID